jgi:hypothetical protein
MSYYHYAHNPEPSWPGQNPQNQTANYSYTGLSQPNIPSQNNVWYPQSASEPSHFHPSSSFTAGGSYSQHDYSMRFPTNLLSAPSMMDSISDAEQPLSPLHRSKFRMTQLRRNMQHTRAGK